MATRPDPSRRTSAGSPRSRRSAVRHGFGYFFETPPADRPATLGREHRSSRDAAAQRGVHLREMLDELGPTFVKFGQLLSTRPDVVPPDIIAELRELQDDVRPFPFEEVEQVVEEELGLPLERLFLEFERDADRGRLDRPGAPRGAPERAAGRRQGAAARTRRGRSRPTSRSSTRRRASRRSASARSTSSTRARSSTSSRRSIRAGARLPARGAERATLPPQLRGRSARRASRSVYWSYSRRACSRSSSSRASQLADVDAPGRLHARRAAPTRAT